jgi:hypothetical protein
MKELIVLCLILISGLGIVACPTQIKQNSTDYYIREPLINATDNNPVSTGNCSIRVWNSTGSLLEDWITMENEGDGNYNYTFNDTSIVDTYNYQINCTVDTYTAISENRCYTVYESLLQEQVNLTYTLSNATYTLSNSTNYTLTTVIQPALSSIQSVVANVYNQIISGSWARQVWDNSIVPVSQRTTKGDTIPPSAKNSGSSEKTITPK